MCKKNKFIILIDLFDNMDMKPYVNLSFNDENLEIIDKSQCYRTDQIGI